MVHEYCKNLLLSKSYFTSKWTPQIGYNFFFSRSPSLSHDFSFSWPHISMIFFGFFLASCTQHGNKKEENIEKKRHRPKRKSRERIKKEEEMNRRDSVVVCDLKQKFCSLPKNQIELMRTKINLFGYIIYVGQWARVWVICSLGFG